MAGKIARKAVQAVGELLDLGILSRPKVGLPKGFSIGKPREPEVNPELTLNKDPMRRMLHITSSKVPYAQPAAGLRDTGLHLTDNPTLDTYYGFLPDETPYVPGTSMAGPRAYPMLVDPGKTLQFNADAIDWTNPDKIIQQMRNAFDQRGVEMNLYDYSDIIDDLSRGKTFGESVQNKGYQSVEYPHFSPTSPYNPDHSIYTGLMLFDPTRAVPEWTEAGQRLAKDRGVIPLAGRDPGVNLETAKMLHGIEEVGDEEFIKRVMNPDYKKMAERAEFLESMLRVNKVIQNRKIVQLTEGMRESTKDELIAVRDAMSKLLW